MPRRADVKSISIPSKEEEFAPSKRSVSSFQALRHAVSSLYRVDDFVMETLGSGFFSQVYKVTHKTTNQVMVLKMNINFTNRPNMLREVQLMNRLNHPNILKFMGVCVHEGQLHALTEYLNSGCLEELLADSKHDIPWSMRLKLAADMAKGMRYLHSRCIIHRDLTSKNVLLRETNGDISAVVGDFGLACKLPDPLTEKDKVLPTVGSPYWMAPECINGQVYNEKADVFSYGIILCEVIARVEADPDVLPRTKHFGVDYVAFSKLIPEIPQEFLGFLHLALNCCQIDPKKRHSFIEIVNSIEELKSKSQMAAVLADISSLQLEDREGINKAKLEAVLGSRKRSIHRLPSVTVELAKEMSPPRIDLLPEVKPDIDLMNMTPQVLAEFHCQRDEFYTPHRDNPFTTRFKDANAKQIGSVRENWQAWFELPSPSRALTPPATPSTPDDVENRSRPLHLRLRNCYSLPGSPTMTKKEFDRFQFTESNRAKRTFGAINFARRFDEESLMGEDCFDARSEGGSSTDSAVGLDFALKDFHSYFTSPCGPEHRKMSMEASFLNTSVDRFRSRSEMLHWNAFRPDYCTRDEVLTRRFRQSVRERPSSCLGDDLFCSTSSSESCMSVDDALVLSPSSSYSSYSDFDPELHYLQTSGHHDSLHNRHRSRQRFQELVKAWETKMQSQAGMTATPNDDEAGAAPLLTPSHFRYSPRSLFSKDSCEYYLERVRKFQELKRKWESHQPPRKGSALEGDSITTAQDVLCAKSEEPLKSEELSVEHDTLQKEHTSTSHD